MSAPDGNGLLPVSVPPEYALKTSSAGVKAGADGRHLFEEGREYASPQISGAPTAGIRPGEAR